MFNNIKYYAEPLAVKTIKIIISGKIIRSNQN